MSTKCEDPSCFRFRHLIKCSPAELVHVLNHITQIYVGRVGDLVSHTEFENQMDKAEVLGQEFITIMQSRESTVFESVVAHLTCTIQALEEAFEAEKHLMKKSDAEIN